jgi:hypothetical protein
MKDKSVGERYPRWFISRHRKGRPEFVDISDGARDVFQGVKFSTAVITFQIAMFRLLVALFQTRARHRPPWSPLLRMSASR